MDHKLQEVFLKTEETQQRTGLEQQKWSFFQNQVDSHIKKEQEELWSSQQHHGLAEDHVSQIQFTSLALKSKNKDEPQSLQCHQSQADEKRETKPRGSILVKTGKDEGQMKTGSDEKDCGGLNPAHSINQDNHLLQTDSYISYPCLNEDDNESVDSDFWKETRERQPDTQQLFVTKDTGPSEQHRWNSTLDSDNPQLPHIKQEQEELWIGQEREHEQRLKQADITKNLRTSGSVKSEHYEVNLQSSQCCQAQSEERTHAKCPDSSSAELLKKEADGDTCADSQSVSDFSPDNHFQTKANDKETAIYKYVTEDSNDSVDSDFWKENRARQSYSADKCNVDEKPFSCSKCGKRFVYKHHLRKHMRVTKEKPFSCSECSQSFGYKNSLMAHMKIHAGVKLFSCSECGKRFVFKNSLKMHLRIHTGDKPFSCSQCHKRFIYQNHLKIHMRVHTGEKPFSCSQCGHRFGYRNNLMDHMRIHTGEKPFSCSLCGQKFSCKNDMKRHARIHTGEKPFSCSICAKKFTQRSNLTKHMRGHTGEKQFGCSECGKRFIQRSQLTTHMRIHTGEKPYMCTNCGKTFGDKSSLNRHVRIHTGEKSFRCSFCGKGFTQSVHLAQHVRVHTREKRFSCDVCNSKFISKASLTRHVCTGMSTEHHQDQNKMNREAKPQGRSSP
ncbi:oocyte zinc finger protein XlCOF22-like [Thalassophryne amazonica]|uniref:oocyte zinc finger protein XlCOF22-like n=1 Tax=Thalassophryne amazonica TaxID=390379 RepID=UPI0014712CCF|nr:oocyte zinc finger protein XlCOF22-like [Thalassophryne amazonica]